MRTDYQDFETIHLNMRQAFKSQKKNKNASGICINLFKVKTLIMIEEIAPPQKNKGRKYLNLEKQEARKKEKKQIINKINP